MPSYVTPKKNTAFVLYCGLVSQANTSILKANPTLAAGDAKVSIDGGAFNNLTTLPVVTPAAGTAVKVSLSSSEMNGDNIVVALIDAAGAEWCDLMISIQTTARQIDDLATAASQATIMTSQDAHTTLLNQIIADLEPEIQNMILTQADHTTTLAAILSMLNDGVTVSLAGRQDIAEKVLTMDWTTIDPNIVADRSALMALRFLRNAWAVANGYLTVSGDDDTGSVWSKPVTTEARNPINSMGADV